MKLMVDAEAAQLLNTVLDGYIRHVGVNGVETVNKLIAATSVTQFQVIEETPSETPLAPASVDPTTSQPTSSPAPSSPAPPMPAEATLHPSVRTIGAELNRV